MAYGDAGRGKTRFVAIFIASLVTGLLMVALAMGKGAPLSRILSDDMEVVAIRLPPPPTPEPDPAPKPAAPKPEGAASAANLKNKASPIVAPKPKIPRETPVRASPVAGQGSANNAGASDRPGPGSGAGGSGSGSGSGSAGSGGGGGGGTKARLVKGTIRNKDYPKAAARARATGTVIAHFTVGTDGRVSGCTIKRSSGNAELDATTCRLATERFRYDPARDASGRPVATKVGWQQVWWLENGRGEVVE